MPRAVVPRTAGDDRKIRLGLGGIVERDGGADANVVPPSESPLEGQVKGRQRRRVPIALGLADDQQAVEQLDPVVGGEDTPIDEAFVLRAGPATVVKRRHLHGLAEHPSPFSRSNQRTRTGTLRRVSDQPVNPASPWMRDSIQKFRPAGRVNVRNASTATGLAGEPSTALPVASSTVWLSIDPAT